MNFSARCFLTPAQEFRASPAGRPVAAGFARHLFHDRGGAGPFGLGAGNIATPQRIIAGLKMAFGGLRNFAQRRDCGKGPPRGGGAGEGTNLLRLLGSPKPPKTDRRKVISEPGGDEPTL